MSTIEHETTKDKEIKAPCKKCDGYTFHTVLHSVQNNYTDFFSKADFSEDYEIIMCQGCREISFRKCSSNSEDELTDEETGEVFPNEKISLYPSRLAGRKPITGLLPLNVHRLYSETHATLCNGYQILTGIGIRTLVESVCSDQKASGANLEQKIDDLVTKGVLTKGNADILHTTRLMGNKAAHEFIAAKQLHLDVAMDIIENLLLNVYIIPSQARWLKK